MDTRPLILVSNDDGITANGIYALIEVAREFGDVVVVAPDSHQSGKSHALTMGKPLRLKETHVMDGVRAYACSGTPSDCMKIAFDVVLDRKPDLCLSGINHGTNVATNVIYSGTMAAAMEGALIGVNSIGLSIYEYDHGADLTEAKVYTRQLIELALNKDMPASKLINVNFPPQELGKVKGMRICKQANAKWKERFDERTDPFGRKYYWLTGDFVNHDESKDSDVNALSQGYISIVPIQHDYTAREDLSFYKDQWNLI